MMKEIEWSGLPLANLTLSTCPTCSTEREAYIFVYIEEENAGQEGVGHWKPYS